MKTALYALVFCALCSIPLHVFSQVVPDEPSFKLDVGAGGGVSFPVSDLGDRTSRGYTVGGKVRIHGFAPVQFAGGVHFNSLPFTQFGFFNSSGSLQHWIFDGGLEIPVPMRREYPYLSFDFLFSAVGNTGSSYITTSSSGVGLGVGMVEPLSRFADIDFSLKYQMLNVWGKDPFDGNFNQIQLAAHVMVGVVR